MPHHHHWLIFQSFHNSLKIQMCVGKNSDVVRCEKRQNEREKQFSCLNFDFECRMFHLASKTCHCHQVAEPFLVMLDSYSKQ